MKATLTFSCTRLCCSQAWKGRDGVRFAQMLNKQLPDERRCFPSSLFSFVFFWPAFHQVPVVCDAQRRFTEMFLNHVFLTWLFTSPCRLATVPRSSLGAAVESCFCMWVQQLLENTPAVAVHRLQKPPCPPARRAFSPVPVLKEKHLWLWCITHRALHPPPPALDAQAKAGSCV